MIVHHLVLLAVGLSAPFGQGQQMRSAYEHLQPVIEKTYLAANFAVASFREPKTPLEKRLW